MKELGWLMGLHCQPCHGPNLHSYRSLFSAQSPNSIGTGNGGRVVECCKSECYKAQFTFRPAFSNLKCDSCNAQAAKAETHREGKQAGKR